MSRKSSRCVGGLGSIALSVDRIRGYFIHGDLRSSSRMITTFPQSLPCPEKGKRSHLSSHQQPTDQDLNRLSETLNYTVPITIAPWFWPDD